MLSDNASIPVNGKSQGEAVLLPPEETHAGWERAKALTPAPVTGTLPARDWAGVAHRVVDGAGAAWRLFWKLVKLGICIGLDVFDFTAGRLLGFGIAVDVGCALICAALWGRRGWWCLWEVVDITEQFDAFIPICTIVALKSWNDEG